MCDYSLENYLSAAVKVGDKLVMSSRTHGFTTVENDKMTRETNGRMLCLACIKEAGTVLELTLKHRPGHSLTDCYTGAPIQPGTYKAVYKSLGRRGSHNYRDALVLDEKYTVLVAYLPREGQTSATVLSIPSVTAARKAAATKAAATRAKNARAKARKAKKALKESLETRLGLDKLNGRVTTAKDPAKVRAAYRRATTAKKRSAAKA